MPKWPTRVSVPVMCATAVLGVAGLAVASTTNRGPFSSSAVVGAPRALEPAVTSSSPSTTVALTIPPTTLPPTTAPKPVEAAMATVPTTVTTAPPVSAPRAVSPATTAAGVPETRPGHFSGLILRDGRALANVTVKVVNITTPRWPRMDVLETLGGHDGVDVFVTTTGANGRWSVTGLPADKQFMVKVFPPSLCDAYGELAARYTTAEAGYINANGEPFMSTRQAPGGATYNIGATGRYLFDMPVHVYPTVGGALRGDQGYNDLDVRFYTRSGSFNTTRGVKSDC